MKEKLIHLYKNDEDSFVRLVSLFYNETIEAIFIPYQEINSNDKNICFLIKGLMYDANSVIDNMSQTLIQFNLLKEFGIID